MTQRITALTAYFIRSLTLSVTGVLYIISGIAFWVIMFPPGQTTPEPSYYVLVLAAFGTAITFLATLTISSKANQAANVPWIVRLPSRVEYLTAVFLASTIFTLILQFFVGILALFRGPELPLDVILQIPPIWISLNVLTAVLALHATDFVASGWSRVHLFGLIALFLFGQSLGTASSNSSWIIVRLNALSRTLLREGYYTLANPLNNLSNWLQNDGAASISHLFGLPFWPFHAIAEAVVAESFNMAQALAPAIILLYATLLVLLASDLFATKDLDLTE
ncbi:MAG: hypothetical protein CSA11_08520 [Chloroflexi bacterium]|nr:MAG: hypothetical protein CSB13_04460 [Chloroflexota bacterium]PIE80353.1 MAG: hypothetical protein CSA11_08520 [Chloroflexota bacterium]